MSHASRSCSGASCWLVCPGAPRICATVPEIQDENDCAIGTAAHEVGYQCIKGELNPDDFLGKVVEKVVIDESIVAGAKIYVSQVRSYPGHIRLYEEKIDLRQYGAKNCWGTLDAAVYDRDTKTLRIGDYKNGVQDVEAEYNPQLQMYALGAMNELLLRLGETQISEIVERVIIEVIQPNSFTSDEPIKTWETTPQELLIWAFNVLVPGASRTQDPDAPLFCGAHCFYCEGKIVCPEFRAKAYQLANAYSFNVDEGKFPDPEAITPAHLVEMSEFLTLLSRGIKEIAGHKTHLARAGTHIPGHKLVRPKRRRMFNDNVEFDLEMKGIDPYKPQSIISVAEAERRLKDDQGYKPKDAKEAILDLWYDANENSEPVLVPNSDKRKEVQATNLFDNMFA